MSYYNFNNINSAYDYGKTQAFYKSAYDEIDKELRGIDNTKELTLSNIYSYKKSKAQNRLLYVIIIMCIILIIISYVNKMYNLLDDNMYAFTIGTILGLTIIYVGYSLWDFSFRDNINYDEYDYGKFGTIVSTANNTATIVVPDETDYTSTVDASSCVVSVLPEGEQTISTFFASL